MIEGQMSGRATQGHRTTMPLLALPTDIPCHSHYYLCIQATYGPLAATSSSSSQRRTRNTMLLLSQVTWPGNTKEIASCNCGGRCFRTTESPAAKHSIVTCSHLPFPAYHKSRSVGFQQSTCIPQQPASFTVQ